MIAKSGYLSLLIDSIKFSLPEEYANKQLTLEISIGELSVKTDPQLPAQAKWGQSFLIQIPENAVPKLFLRLQTHEEAPVTIGESRYDITPFFSHEAMTSILTSDLVYDDNKSAANFTIKLTYYNRHGRLRIRVLDVYLGQALASKYKSVYVRFKLHSFIKTTEAKGYPAAWDDVLELMVLSPNFNLNIELLSEGNVIGEFTIYNIEKSGYLKEKKVWENNLFHEEKYAGKIKYECEVLKD